MRVGDIGAVAALAAGESTAPHWPLAEYRRMLQVIEESPARRGAWVLLLDRSGSHQAVVLRAGLRRQNADPATGMAEGILAGFAMASHVAGICDLEAVVVTARWRGRRFGASLVEAVANWGTELGASRLELEVRASNAAALRLYQRMGFTVDGTRPGYYRNPEEEAVLMSLPLQPETGEAA